MKRGVTVPQVVAQFQQKSWRRNCGQELSSKALAERMFKTSIIATEGASLIAGHFKNGGLLTCTIC